MNLNEVNAVDLKDLKSTMFDEIVHAYLEVEDTELMIDEVLNHIRMYVDLLGALSTNKLNGGDANGN